MLMAEMPTPPAVSMPYVALVELKESLQLYHTLMAEMPPPPAVSMPYVAPGTKKCVFLLREVGDNKLFIDLSSCTTC